MHNINILEMFFNAGPIVQFVMLLLLFFSVTSWVIIIQKLLIFRRIRSASEAFLENFWSADNLSQFYRDRTKQPECPEMAIFTNGYNELQKLGRIKQQEKTGGSLSKTARGILQRALENAENRESNQLSSHLSFLATTGSSTPFIGLFGTVWGIMNSFQEIGVRGSASLAVVAPGISEALVATAAGLAAAIPAVIFYNHFSNQLTSVEDEMGQFSSEFLNLVERDLLNRI